MAFSIIFPGQGSQVINMMSDLAAHHSLVKELFEQASDTISIDLWKLTQEGPIESLSLTENTQPALLTAGYAAWRVWQEQGGDQPAMMAGHSLGEYTALVCASAIEFTEGVALVHDRGRYMQQAVTSEQGAMAAILGLDDQQVIDACASAAKQDILQAVNFNAPGQVVIAGHATAVERGIDLLKEAGARRAILLPVSIPAHSSLMSPASIHLAERLEKVTISMPTIPVIHNYSVSVANSTEEVASNLIHQLDSPVRWVETVEYMHKQGIEQFIESGPGQVLSGLVRRIVKGTNVACIEKSDTCAKLIAA